MVEQFISQRCLFYLVNYHWCSFRGRSELGTIEQSKKLSGDFHNLIFGAAGLFSSVNRAMYVSSVSYSGSVDLSQLFLGFVVIWVVWLSQSLFTVSFSLFVICRRLIGVFSVICQYTYMYYVCALFVCSVHLWVCSLGILLQGPLWDLWNSLCCMMESTTPFTVPSPKHGSVPSLFINMA